MKINFKNENDYLKIEYVIGLFFLIRLIGITNPTEGPPFSKKACSSMHVVKISRKFIRGEVTPTLIRGKSLNSRKISTEHRTHSRVSYSRVCYPQYLTSFHLVKTFSPRVTGECTLYPHFSSTHKSILRSSTLPSRKLP